MIVKFLFLDIKKAILFNQVVVVLYTSTLIVYFVVHIAVSGGGILVFFNFQILIH